MIGKWLALFGIRLYQRTISRVVPPSCRFVPSCSEYGYEAIARYGVIRGGVMAVWRVMRCNPWGGHGYDPVPERAAGSRQKQESRGERQEDTQSSCGPEGTRSPQSFITNTALTPYAPGHSLTEGLQ
ncbi:MAG: membrane protein insertion efficiency factor YidD [Thermomicrobiales bacterium]